MAAVPDRAEYLRRWSALHQGHDPGATPFVRGWLSLVHALAAPLARAGIRPDTVTLAGAVLSVFVPVAAASRWLGAPPAAVAFVAAVLVFVSGISDNIDGAVAALTGSSSKWGYVLDSVCDRIADVAYLLGLWALGAPGPLVAAGGVLTGFQEYTRARAIAGGMTDIGVITIAERPTRVLVAGMFCLAAAVLPGSGDHRIAVWVTVGAAVWTGAHAVGLVQVLRAVGRALR